MIGRWYDALTYYTYLSNIFVYYQYNIGYAYYFCFLHGIRLTFENEYLDMVHRCCLHHIHANLKSNGYKGTEFKDVLWATATSTSINQTDFDVVIKPIETVNPSMH